MGECGALLAMLKIFKRFRYKREPLERFKQKILLIWPMHFLNETPGVKGAGAVGLEQ